MDLGVEGKVYMIAGASKGLGLAIARCLAADGAAVSIASRDADGVTRAAQTLAGEVRALCSAAPATCAIPRRSPPGSTPRSRDSDASTAW